MWRWLDGGSGRVDGGSPHPMRIGRQRDSHCAECHSAQLGGDATTPPSSIVHSPAPVNAHGQHGVLGYPVMRREPDAREVHTLQARSGRCRLVWTSSTRSRQPYPAHACPAVGANCCGRTFSRLVVRFSCSSLRGSLVSAWRKNARRRPTQPRAHEFIVIASTLRRSVI